MNSQFDADYLNSLLTQALNGWGAHARTKAEHADIARIRDEQRGLERFKAGRTKPQPRRQVGPLAARLAARRAWLIANRDLGWEAWLLVSSPHRIPHEKFVALYRRMQLAGLFSQTSGVQDAKAWVLTAAEAVVAELSKETTRG